MSSYFFANELISRLAQERRSMSMNLEYQTGFGNEFATEAVEGALPVGRIRRKERRWAIRRAAFGNGIYGAPLGQ